VLMEPSDAEVARDESKHGSVIGARRDPQPQAILTVLRPAGAGAREDDETTLAIHDADEPRIAGSVRWHAAWHTFAREAFRKGLEDAYLVDQAVPLGDRPQTLAGLLCDFRVAKASEKQITLTSIQGSLTLTISNIGQLWFVLRCGSIVPYSKLYADASRFANALQPKQDLGMPWRFARALQDDGWILRSPIIWAKPNPMPESCTDRPTSAHEHVFLMTKAARYFYDQEAIREPVSPYNNGRGVNVPLCDGYNGDRMRNGPTQATRQYDTIKGANARNWWVIPTHAFPEAHFATYPPELVERCIRAGTSERGCCAACGAPWVRVTEHNGYTESSSHNYAPCPNKGLLGATGNRAANMTRDGFTPNRNRITTTTGWRASCQCAAGDPVPCTVLDPFLGSGTTALVSDRLRRNAIGIDLSLTYADMAQRRIEQDAGMFAELTPAEPPEDDRMADLFAEAAE
jgi:hypothetical protein